VWEENSKCQWGHWPFLLVGRLSQPHFGISVKMKLTPPKVGSWSPPGLPKTQSLSSKVKTPRIEVFFISIERSWSVDAQNGLHVPFGHLQPKLWAKEGPGVKLLVWLPTIKSQESTSSQRRLKECNMALESSRGELQLWFRPHSNQRSEPRDMSSQSPGTISGLLLGSLGKSSHLDVASTGSCREYYMGEGGGFPRI
jgi:hypothetical protein